MWFLTQAGNAAASGSSSGSALISLFVPLLLMVLVFYLLIWRPQSKRNKERKKLLSSLQKGDQIITIGGLHGTIEELTEETVVIKVNESMKLTFDRSAIHSTKGNM